MDVIMSICKSKQRNGYLVQVCYKTSDGRKKQLSKLVHNLKDAKIVEAKLQAEVKGEHFNGDNLTFAEVAKMFLEDSKAIRRISTIDRYETNIRVHLLPYFGDKILAKIQPLEIKIWKENKQKEVSKATGKHYSFAHLKKLMKAFSVVFNYAKHIDLRLNKLEHFSKSTYLCGGYEPIADETMLQVKD